MGSKISRLITLIISITCLTGIVTASNSPIIDNNFQIKTDGNMIIQYKKEKEVQNYTEKLTQMQTEIDDNIEISDCIMIGDSNTVRMDMYDTEISKSKHISAIVGVGVGGFSSYTNSSNTTYGLTLKSDLDRINNSDFNNVIIMLGTNDFNKDEDTFKDQYKSILEYIYTRNSKAKVYMVTVPPVNNSKSPSIQDKDADEISRFIQEISNDYIKLDTEIIDLNNYLSSYDMSSSYGDGYHLSKDGADKAAKYIIENL